MVILNKKKYIFESLYLSVVFKNTNGKLPMGCSLLRFYLRFYLRFLPLKTTLNTIKDYETQEIPATLYVHSWELTPEFMPKIKLPIKEKFVTFHNISKTFERLE